MFKIDKGVKVQKKSVKTDRQIRYPLGDMEIKDSFFVPCDTKDKQNVVRSSIYYEYRFLKLKSKDKKYKILTRLVNENGCIGIRTWRTR